MGFSTSYNGTKPTFVSLFSHSPTRGITLFTLIDKMDNSVGQQIAHHVERPRYVCKCTTRSSVVSLTQLPEQHAPLWRALGFEVATPKALEWIEVLSNRTSVLDTNSMNASTMAHCKRYPRFSSRLAAPTTKSRCRLSRERTGDRRSQLSSSTLACHTASGCDSQRWFGAALRIAPGPRQRNLQRKKRT